MVGIAFLVFLAVMLLGMVLTDPKLKRFRRKQVAPKYDPHYVRRMEIKQLGAAKTFCDNDNCFECFPDTADYSKVTVDELLSKVDKFSNKLMSVPPFGGINVEVTEILSDESPKPIKTYSSDPVTVHGIPDYKYRHRPKQTT